MSSLEEGLVSSQNAAAQIAQVQLRMQYQQLRHSGAPLPELGDVEFRCFSQNGEDGILLYLFALAGVTNRRVVEVCAGNGIECNAANLIVNHGWYGLLLDGAAANVACARAFYSRCRTTMFRTPVVEQAWITRENIDRTIAGHSFTGDIDLLSLDIDGNDYWIWQAINCVRPRVAVVEFNALLGPERRLTLPYDPEFQLDFSRTPYQAGASLAAFVALARDKGLRLVGVQALGFNAFFVRDGLCEDVLPTRTVAECFAGNDKLRGYDASWLAAMYRDGQRWEEV